MACNAGKALMTEETIEHITGVIAAKGSDAWYQMPVQELLPDSLKHEADQLDKGQDTMDVWSVVLHTARCFPLFAYSTPRSTGSSDKYSIVCVTHAP